MFSPNESPREGKKISLHRRKISEVSFTDSVAESFVSTGINSVFSTGSTATNFSFPSTDVIPTDTNNWDEELKGMLEDLKSNKPPLEFTHDMSNLKIRYYHEFWGMSPDQVLKFKLTQEEEFMRQSRMMEIFYYVKNIRFRMRMLTEFVDPIIISKLKNMPNVDKLKIQISWMALMTIFDTFCINLKRIFDGQILVNINSFISILGHSFNKLNKKYKDFSESSSILRDFIEKGFITQQEFYDYNNQLKIKYNLSYNDSVDLSLLMKGYILTMLSKFHDPLLKLQKSISNQEINDVVSMYKNIQLTIDFFSPQQSSIIVSKLINSNNLIDSSSLYSINASNHDRKLIFLKHGSWSKLWGGNYCQGKIVLFDNYLLLIESNENGEEKLSYPPMNLIDLDLDQDMHDAMFLQFKETLSILKSNEGSDFKIKIKNSNSNTFAFTNNVTGLQIVGVFEELKLKFGRTGFQILKLQQQISKVNLNKCYKIDKIDGCLSNFEFNYGFKIKLNYLLISSKQISINKNNKLSILFETENSFGKCDIINGNLIFLHDMDLYTLPIEELLLKSTKWKLLSNFVIDFEIKLIDGNISLYILTNDSNLQLMNIDNKFLKIFNKKILANNVKSIKSFEKFGIVYTKIKNDDDKDDNSPQLYLIDSTPLLNLNDKIKSLLKDEIVIGVFYKPDQNQIIIGYTNYILTAFLKIGFQCDIFEDRILKLNFPQTSMRYDIDQDLIFTSNQNDKLDVWEFDFNRDSKDISYTELIICMRVSKFKFLNSDPNLIFQKEKRDDNLGTVYNLSIC